MRSSTAPGKIRLIGFRESLRSLLRP
jgi:hypothetical protein